MPRTGQPAIRRVAAVERAVTLLNALAESGADLGTNEIARRTGINPSSVSRLLATLVASDLVQHIPDTGRYRLGLRLLQLGNLVLARLDLREAAHPHLAALAEATGETATLSVPGEGEAVTVDFVQSAAWSAQSIARVGRPSVAHATAVGKVFLACGGELPDEALTAFTKTTITDPEELAEEVSRTASRGWAEALGERELDLNAIAAPITGRRGELVAILGLQGPADRFNRRAMRAALDQLLASAARLSAGHPG
jgi:IclR family acetate operon transcriptional repressor